MRLGILGHGRFGAALGGLASEHGHSYLAWDPAASVPVAHAATSLEQLTAESDLIAVAVPIQTIRTALSELRPLLSPSHLVFDVASVKVAPCATMDELLGAEIPHVGTHPLFGPVSLARAERPLRVVVSASPQHPAAADRMVAWYEGLGCDVLRQSSADHDRVMAISHALTFFLAKGLLAVGAGAELPFTPPSFRTIARTLDSVREDAGHLFAALQNENPFAFGARSALLEAMTAIHAELAEAAETGVGDPLAIPALGPRSPALQEVRDHIDTLDQELVALLARRTELALKAGRAKATLGVPVHDPSREAAQLEMRRRWAQDAGIEPAAVDEVFRAVLRASRAAQGQ